MEFTFRIMLGDIEVKDSLDNGDGDFYDFGALWTFMIVVVMLINIILLNLIISLVGETYQKVDAIKEPLKAKLRAEKILEVRRMCSPASSSSPQLTLRSFAVASIKKRRKAQQTSEKLAVSALTSFGAPRF